MSGESLEAMLSSDVVSGEALLVHGKDMASINLPSEHSTKANANDGFYGLKLCLIMLIATVSNKCDQQVSRSRNHSPLTFLGTFKNFMRLLICLSGICSVFGSSASTLESLERTDRIESSPLHTHNKASILPAVDIRDSDTTGKVSTLRFGVLNICHSITHILL